MSTVTNFIFPKPELWGGIECTINRVGDNFNDQLTYSGHYSREDDIDTISALGIRKLRYPVLWERQQPERSAQIDWAWCDQQLDRIRISGIIPIATLLHHGSGPAFTQLDDDEFPSLFAAYASKVAARYPWIEYYTPVNESLTTARFSGLYGFWYPHAKNDLAFLRMLINQVKGIVLSMIEIRKINPHALLVQTEDLACTHSTPKLSYQANFENKRRWLTYDLLCGKVDQQHPLWNYITGAGIAEKQLLFFLENKCLPDIIGLNYYVTSERYLDENVSNYPAYTHGGNTQQRYADTEAVRVEKQGGLGSLLKEVWQRYHIPMAITECHLNCSREEQLRWVNETWDTCVNLSNEGLNIKAVTVWSLLGAYNWNSLLTRNDHQYESGAFDILNNKLRPTAITKLIHSIANDTTYEHPLLCQKGWWNKSKDRYVANTKKTFPLLIIGKNGTLGNALTKICGQRSIPYIALSKKEVNICDESSVRNAIDNYKPWAVINAAGFVKVDDAETNRDECFRINSEGPKFMGAFCHEKGIRFMTFSSDLVFDGFKNSPYLESDHVMSLNVYGRSKAKGEQLVQQVNPASLIIRTSGFFGPWDRYNFVYNVIESIKTGQRFVAAGDVFTSPTYVPDLVNVSLDLFIDEETGIWHITNDGVISWAEFAKNVAERHGFKKDMVEARPASAMNWKARRPLFSALQSDRGIRLPSLDNALERYFQDPVF